MIKADYSHKSTVIKILTDSFLENQSIHYVVRQDSKRIKRTQQLIDYSFNVCSAFGEVWISEDQKGCALVLLPDHKKTTVESVLWDVKLATSVIGLSRVIKVMNRESEIKKKHPIESFAYLWYIGVDPAYQGNGIGTKLLRELLAEYDARDKPIYLETSTLRNIPWYEENGFEIYGKLSFTYQLFMLRRLLSTS